MLRVSKSAAVLSFLGDFVVMLGLQLAADALTHLLSTDYFLDHPAAVQCRPDWTEKLLMLIKRHLVTASWSWLVIYDLEVRVLNRGHPEALLFELEFRLSAPA